jgi:cation diffusion facilitator family transporter
MHTKTIPAPCTVRRPVAAERKERGLRLVVGLTAVTMVIEIVVGYATGSMALLADGWHMATHVAALGLAALAYAAARRYADHHALAFGTGKVRALAGFASAVALALVAVATVGESIARLAAPHAIDYARSLPVAVIGLVVNLASVALLHAHGEDDHHGHDHHGHDHHGHDHDGHDHHGHDHHGHDHHGHDHHGHDHNHRAAAAHVVADAFTSVLAIVALVVGRELGWVWADAVSGVVGGCLILVWGQALARAAGAELLDVVPSTALARELRGALEAIDDVQVRDLHVWSIGGGRRCCVVSLVSAVPREPAAYRATLRRFRLDHVTIEVERCHHPAADAAPAHPTSASTPS